jgi:hypothetical protein
MTQSHEAPHEPLDIVDILDLAYFGDGRHLVGVRFNAAFIDDVPRSLPRGTPKVHFSGFSLMLKCLRLAKVSSRSAMRFLLSQVFMTKSLT